MIIEKYGKIVPTCRFAGKRVVCNSCKSTLIFQADDECSMVTKEDYGWNMMFDCPFCGERRNGAVYKNGLVRFAETHKITRDIYHFMRRKYWDFVALMGACLCIGGLGLGCWYLIQDELKYKEAYCYTIYIDDGKHDNTYYTNDYDINGETITFYIEDNPNNMIYADVSKVQIVSRDNKEAEK